MSAPKYNRLFLTRISLVTALGGLLFGYDWVVIGGAKPFYERFFGIAESPALQGWAMSCAIVGCLLGSVLSGMLSDKYGRKILLIFSALLFMVSAIGTGAVDSFNAFILFRILGGIGIGLASNLSPMYIAEVAPANIRGSYVSINQLTIVIGILMAQIVNWLIAQPVPEGATAQEILFSWNGQTGWRLMFWACAVPACIFFLLMWFVPESPRWLAQKKGDRQKAKQILIRIGGEAYAEEEIKSIEAISSSESEKINYKELFKPKMLSILILGITLAVFQQWCGINVIFNYAEEIFTAAGYGVSDILFNIIITGSVNLIFTLVAMFSIDRVGRKVLMLIGAGGLAGIYGILGLLFFLDFTGGIMLLLVLVAIACYAMSLAPVTWVVLSEIFPNRVRGVAMSISTNALWSACFLLTYTFPLFNEYLKAAGTFWLYGIICVAGFVYIKYRLPETKGKSLEAIERELLN